MNGKGFRKDGTGWAVAAVAKRKKIERGRKWDSIVMR